MIDEGRAKRLTRLVKLLYDRTTSGEIEWKVTRNIWGRRIFRSSTPTYTVTLKSGGMTYSINVRDGRGDMILEYEAGSLAGPTIPGLDRDIERLYKAVFESAIDVDGALDEIIHDLEGR
ncbi:hypothetical protein [Micromonospora sp. NBRC 110037]|uniref:hypothetical protein n=1 Tax=Micromonospora sp. NBRC 110037 TaxID=1621261 RepID=UPI000B2B3B6D|nr:hypothetical protein [Micromonospora sp. NBRC 110037]